MKQYLLSIYTPDSEPPPPEQLDEIMRNVGALQEEMRDAGAWVFSGGLNAPGTATVVQAKGSEVLVTDGPFLEGKEYLGGFDVIRAADLDEALGWARKLAAVLEPLWIEVRPFVDEAD
jgi:hypothetical protein